MWWTYSSRKLVNYSLVRWYIITDPKSFQNIRNNIRNVISDDWLEKSKTFCINIITYCTASFDIWKVLSEIWNNFWYFFGYLKGFWDMLWRLTKVLVMLSKREQYYMPSILPVSLCTFVTPHIETYFLSSGTCYWFGITNCIIIYNTSKR